MGLLAYNNREVRVFWTDAAGLRRVTGKKGWAGPPITMPGGWDGSAEGGRAAVGYASMKIFWVSIFFFPVTGCAACVWALLDVLQRPSVQFRVAGMSKPKRAWGFGIIGVAIATIAAVFGFGGTNHFLGLGLFFSAQCLGAMGLLSAAWYLLAVRRWLGAQLRFAKSSPPELLS
jgi:hypothetical protein